MTPVGRRVVVTGPPGSGKSTFALALAGKTGLPVIHLDLQFWKPGWVEPSEDEWRTVQQRVLAGDAWIADGNYRETLALRLRDADTLVVLDMPWWLCAGRALLRGSECQASCPKAALTRGGSGYEMSPGSPSASGATATQNQSPRGG